MTRNAKIQARPAAIDQRSCSRDNCIPGANDLHHFTRRAARCHDVFDNKGARAGFDLKSSSKPHRAVLALRKERAYTKRTRYFMGNDDAADSGSNYDIYMVDALVSADLGAKLRTQSFRKLWVLQDQRALEITWAVKARGQQEMSFQQRAALFKESEDLVSSHTLPSVSQMDLPEDLPGRYRSRYCARTLPQSVRYSTASGSDRVQRANTYPLAFASTCVP